MRREDARRLPPLFLGQDERAFQQIVARTFAVDHDLENVETEGDFGPIEHSEPRARATANQRLLLAVYRIGRAAKLVAASRLYFDKGENPFVPITAHQIHFAAILRPEVPVEDPVAILPQILRRQALALATESVADILLLRSRTPGGPP